MTELREFMAWFSGYVENIDGAPNQKQWGRILSRIRELEEQGRAPRQEAAPANVNPVQVAAVAAKEASWLAQVEGELMVRNAPPHVLDRVMAGIDIDLAEAPSVAAVRLLAAA